MTKREYLTSEVKRLYDAMMTASNKMSAAEPYSVEQKSELGLYNSYRNQWLKAKADLKKFEAEEVDV